MWSDHRWWYKWSVTVSKSNSQLKIYTSEWIDHLANCSIGFNPASQEYNSGISQLSYILLHCMHIFPCGPSSCPCPQATCHCESSLRLILALSRSSIITVNQNVLLKYPVFMMNSHYYDVPKRVRLTSPLSICAPMQISKFGSAPYKWPVIVSFYFTVCSFHIAPNGVWRTVPLDLCSAFTFLCNELAARKDSV